MNRKSMMWSATAVVCAGMVSGCATIVSKSQYPVAITSQPSGAQVTVVDEDGVSFFEGTTPANVTLAAGAGFFRGKDYRVTYSMTGFDPVTVPISRGVDGWYIAGNFFLGGFIGWLIVDPATGAMWKLPEQVSATLSPATSMQEGAESLRIVTLDQVPMDLRDQMVLLH